MNLFANDYVKAVDTILHHDSKRALIKRERNIIYFTEHFKVFSMKCNFCKHLKRETPQKQ